MAKILVTGASGFIGSRIVRHLVERGDDVKVLLRSEPPKGFFSKLPVEIAWGDITIGHTVYRALSGCNRLIHTAAAVRMWSANPIEIMKPSVLGMTEVLGAVKQRGDQIERVVVTSSVATLGTSPSDEDVLTENDFSTLKDPEVYVRAKIEAENIALENSRKLPLVIVNPSVVLGPGDRQPSPNGAMVLRYLNWDSILPFPTSKGGINIVDVDDVARGHLLALDKGQVGQRYILGGENMTIYQMVEVLQQMTGLRRPMNPPAKGLATLFARMSELRARLTDSEPQVSVRTVRDYYDSFLYVSSEKAKNELGYTSRTARKTLARTVRYFLDQQKVRKRIVDEIRMDELPGKDPAPTLPHERDAVYREG